MDDYKGYTTIPKLRGAENWHTWKWDITVTLKGRKLWRYVNDPSISTAPIAVGVAESVPLPPSPQSTTTLSAEELEDRQAVALLVINNTIEEHQKIHIRGCESGKQAWANLCSIYDSKNPSTQLARRRRFFSMTMSPRGDDQFVVLARPCYRR